MTPTLDPTPSRTAGAAAPVGAPPVAGPPFADVLSAEVSGAQPAVRSVRPPAGDQAAEPPAGDAGGVNADAPADRRRDADPSATPAAPPLPVVSAPVGPLPAHALGDAPDAPSPESSSDAAEDQAAPDVLLRGPSASGPDSRSSRLAELGRSSSLVEVAARPRSSDGAQAAAPGPDRQTALGSQDAPLPSADVPRALATGPSDEPPLTAGAAQRDRQPAGRSAEVAGPAPDQAPPAVSADRVSANRAVQSGPASALVTQAAPVADGTTETRPGPTVETSRRALLEPAALQNVSHLGAPNSSAASALRAETPPPDATAPQNAATHRDAAPLPEPGGAAPARQPSPASSPPPNPAQLDPETLPASPASKDSSAAPGPTLPERRASGAARGQDPTSVWSESESLTSARSRSTPLHTDRPAEPRPERPQLAAAPEGAPATPHVSPAASASATALALAAAAGGVPVEEPTPAATDPAAADLAAAEAGAGPAALALDGRSAPSRTAEPAAPPLPARLAMPAWAARLADAAGGRSVQVALGDDGSVRLQTVRDGDGLTVSLRFSDPDLQAFAGLHAARLRDALDAHFAEPVRLSLADGSGGPSDGSPSNGSGAGGSSGREPGGHTPGRSAAPAGRPSDPAPPAAAPPGRREWIG